MTYLIWTLAISFVGIVLMISCRFYELHSNRLLISISTRAKGDQKILTFCRKSIILFNRIYQKVLNQVDQLPKFISSWLHFLWRKISDRIDSFFERIKGRKIIKNKNSTSLYWKSVGSVRNYKK